MPKKDLTSQEGPEGEDDLTPLHDSTEPTSTIHQGGSPAEDPTDASHFDDDKEVEEVEEDDEAGEDEPEGTVHGTGALPITEHPQPGMASQPNPIPGTNPL